MQKRTLGKSDLSIPPLVLGGNVLGWTIDQKRSFEVLDAFVEGGGEAIDTAPIYSYWPKGHKGGESETVLGAWFAQGGKRGRVKLFTKVGAPPDNVKIDAKSIVAACEGSLKRLQTDYIDLYQIPLRRQRDSAGRIHERVRCSGESGEGACARFIEYERSAAS